MPKYIEEKYQSETVSHDYRKGTQSAPEMRKE
jgi:hypothetical protein